jgi:hypothetical protein
MHQMKVIDRERKVIMTKISKITLRHTIFDWKRISKIISGKGFFVKIGFCVKNVKNGPLRGENFFS